MEFALIAPILISLLLGIIQYGSLFLLQTRMTDTARDTARRLAVGDLTTEAEAEDYAVARLADWSATFAAAAELPSPGEHDVRVSITVPMAEAALINLVGFGMDGQLSVEIHMLKE